MHNPPIAATVPPETENSAGFTSLENAVPKPEEIHERPISSSSVDTGNADLEKQQVDDGMSPVEPVKSTTESVYPGGKQTAAVMTALILAIFLVALVSFGRRHRVKYN